MSAFYSLLSLCGRRQEGFFYEEKKMSTDISLKYEFFITKFTMGVKLKEFSNINVFRAGKEW